MNGLSTNNVIGYGGELPSALDFAVSTDMTFELSSTTGRQTYTMNNFKIGYRDGGMWWIGYDGCSRVDCSDGSTEECASCPFDDDGDDVTFKIEAKGGAIMTMSLV
jgi:hypothetical protein